MKKKWWIKLTQYEYYPMWAFYFPLFPYFFIKGILKGNLFYFTNANPGVDKFGGLFFDSKDDIDKQLPQTLRPNAFLVQPNLTQNELKSIIKKEQLSYPIIIKPDKGERGKGVLKLKNESDLFTELNKIEMPHLVQEYIPFLLEFGVFIVYLPLENRFKITSLTEKKFFEVVGNGKHTISELIRQKNRGVVFYNELKENSSLNFETILKLNETIIIHTHGNHCKGTQFIDRRMEVTTKMEAKFNELMFSLNGFYYGRFDIKVKSIADLETFEQLKIIEFNGVAAEPIHIYDSRIGYFKSLFTFIHHWQYLSKISIYLKQKGYKPARFKDVWDKISRRYF